MGESAITTVLHHGFLGLGNVSVGRFRLRYFAGGIEPALTAAGFAVVPTRVHPTASIETRAKQLKQQIETRLPGRSRMVIIGHSMGGLDARYMIRHLGMAERVSALVTISTPHWGSSFADWSLKHLGMRMGAMKVIDALGWDAGAVRDLCCARFAEFNQNVPDVPGVQYFSISAAREWTGIPLFLLPSWRVIQKIEGPNDGLVSVRSAQWGEHLGTWPMDHLHVINKRFVPERSSPESDVVRRYVQTLTMLRERGVLN